MKLLITTLLLSSALLITGCDNSNDPGYSTFSLAVKDAPIDNATAVVVEFDGIELKPQSGPSFSIDLPQSQQINLLDFQGTDAAQLFANVSIEAGNYNWMRLKVNAERQVLDSYIEFEGGEMYSLYVPSGAQTGLQWNQGFTAPANGDVDFTVDFDLRKSVHQPGNSSDDYFLRPTVRVVNNTVVGHIEGSIAATLLDDVECSESSAVYLFEQNDAITDDYGSANEPQTSANVAFNAENTFSYTLGYILPGDYTLGLTCQSDLDDPETDDDIAFVAQQNVSVSENTTTTADFD